MATVYIPALLQNLTGGRNTVQVDGATVRQIVQNLEILCPGIGERLMDGEKLRPNISVAVDGEISPLGLREAVQPSSEVHFVTAIKGGSGSELSGCEN